MFKIMIVDDSPHIAHYLSDLIDWEDYDCILTGVYTNSRNLLADAAKDIPDVVFSDIAMPGVDGLELAEKLYGLNPALKIILISGYSEFAYAKRALELHVYDYLLKPVQLQQLQQLMKKLLAELKQEEIQRHKLSLEESQKKLHYRASLTHYLSRLLFHTSSEEKICAELLRLGFPLSAPYHLSIASLNLCIPPDSYIYNRWEKYQEKNLHNPAVIVDTNHSNSNKQYEQQIRIAKEVLHSRMVDPDLHKLVKGFMIESYIEPGNQKIGGKHIYGKSITDPCLGWDESEELLYTIAEMC